MTCILNLKELFKKLDNYKYLFIKTENVPYMPSNFPEEYAVGKDLDIIVEVNNITELRVLFKEYAKDYSDMFDIRCIDEAYGFRVRFEVSGKLHFQFDVKCMDVRLSETFMKSLIKNRIYMGEYYTSDKRHELIIRMLCYTPQKNYHLTYVKDNIKFLDSTIIPEKLKNKAMDIIKDI